MKRSSKLCFALLAAALSGSVFASAVYTDPNPTIISAPGTTVDVSIVIRADAAVNGFSGALQYDSSLFTVSNFAPCLNPAAGTVVFSATNGGVAYPSDTTICTPTFTYTGVLPNPGDPDVVSPLNWAALDDGQGSATGDAAEIRVQGVPPTTQTITASGNAGGTVTPPSQDVDSGTSGVVTITPSGGFQVASIGGTCGGSPDVAPPTSATVTYTTNPVGTAGDPDHSADCTVTATFQAIPAPIFSSVPAPGSDIACNGPELSDVVRNVVITNDGDLTLNIASCTAGGTHTVDSFPATLAPGASGNLSVTCHVPANGAPAAVDTVTCTHDAAGSPAQYRFSALAQVVPPPIPAPDLVPASSLWSKLMLFGFLAGLGALVISLRRS